MDLDWFKIKVIYPITKELSDSEPDEIASMQIKGEGNFLDGYGTDVGCYDIANDPIVQINPKCFKPNDRVNKRYCSEIVFASDKIVYASDKPEDVYKQLEEYLSRNITN